MEHTAPVVGDPQAAGAVGQRVASHRNAGAITLPVATETRRLADQAHTHAHVARISEVHRRRVAEVVVDRRRAPIVAHCMHTQNSHIALAKCTRHWVLGETLRTGASTRKSRTATRVCCARRRARHGVRGAGRGIVIQHKSAGDGRKSSGTSGTRRMLPS